MSSMARPCGGVYPPIRLTTAAADGTRANAAETLVSSRASTATYSTWSCRSPAAGILASNASTDAPSSRNRSVTARPSPPPAPSTMTVRSVMSVSLGAGHGPIRRPIMDQNFYAERTRRSASANRFNQEQPICALPFWAPDRGARPWRRCWRVGTIAPCGPGTPSWPGRSTSATRTRATWPGSRSRRRCRAPRTWRRPSTTSTCSWSACRPGGSGPSWSTPARTCGPGSRSSACPRASSAARCCG